MGDPLSIAASVITVATLGLQSTKLVGFLALSYIAALMNKIYVTLSSLCKSRKEFAQTVQSLQSLQDVLEQIIQLATRSSLLLSAPSTNGDTDSSLHNEAFYKGFEDAVKKCKDDLQPVVEKVDRWKAAEIGKHKVTSALSWYIKGSDLREIQGVVSRQIRDLNIQLNIINSNQISEQRRSIETSKTEVKGLFTELSTQLRNSTAEVTTHLSGRLDRVDAVFGRNIKHVATVCDATGSSAIQNHHIQGSIKTLEQSLASGFNDFNERSKTIEEMMRQIRQQLNAVEESKQSNDRSQQLQGCIDRLYDLKTFAKGDLDIDTPDAHSITDDLVDILKALLAEVNFPNPRGDDRKRKRGIEEDLEAVKTDNDIKQRRVVKKMRGILDSSQTVQIRSSNWQRDRVLSGRRLESQNRTFETSAGTLAMTAVVLAPDSSQSQPESASEVVTEAFAGTLTLLPKTKGKKMKLRAFFAQHVIRNGVFSFAPTLSFHAIIPDDSSVFQLIESGDLEGLKQILQNGRASLTDCNTNGNSLLGYSLHEERQTRHPHICKYLVSQGADVNSFELFDNEMVPLLFFLHTSPWEFRRDHHDRLNHCRRLLLAAGADPSLCNPQANESGYECCSFLDSVMSMHSDILRLFLDHGGVLVDLENRDRHGYTALLWAIQLATCPSTGSVKNFVEISFELANLLTSRGASCLSKNNDGETCLHLIFKRTYLHQKGVYIYRPHDVLTKLLIRIVEAGGDIFAVDTWGRSPSHLANRNDYDKSWREALSKCGYSPREVYEKSGVEWEELDEVGAEDYLVEILLHIHRASAHAWGPRQWRTATMQKLLVQGIKSDVNLFTHLGSSTTTAISSLMGDYCVDRAFRKALRTCGHDPKVVYSNLVIPWVELEDGEDEEDEEDEDDEEDDEDDEDDEDEEDEEDASENDSIRSATLNIDESHPTPHSECYSGLVMDATGRSDESIYDQNLAFSTKPGGFDDVTQAANIWTSTVNANNRFDNDLAVSDSHPQANLISPWAPQNATSSSMTTTDSVGDGWQSQVQSQPDWSLMDFTYESEVWNESRDIVKDER